jgi:hypothetical protein
MTNHVFLSENRKDAETLNKITLPPLRCLTLFQQ